MAPGAQRRAPGELELTALKLEEQVLHLALLLARRSRRARVLPQGCAIATGILPLAARWLGARR